jgi:hypothetical protein
MQLQQGNHNDQMKFIIDNGTKRNMKLRMTYFGTFHQHQDPIHSLHMVNGKILESSVSMRLSASCLLCVEKTRRRFHSNTKTKIILGVMLQKVLSTFRSEYSCRLDNVIAFDMCSVSGFDNACEAESDLHFTRWRPPETLKSRFLARSLQKATHKC